MVRTIACLPVLVGAWRERGGGHPRQTAWAALRPLDQDALGRPELGHAREVNMVQLGRADRARTADQRARRLQLEPGRDRARQQAGAGGAWRATTCSRS